jgi:hypothetical protein
VLAAAVLIGFVALIFAISIIALMIEPSCVTGGCTGSEKRYQDRSRSSMKPGGRSPGTDMRAPTSSVPLVSSR